MTIRPYGYGAANALAANSNFRTIKGDLDALQSQLSTGKTAQTYAGLGPSASTSLNLASRLATLSGYGANITDATNRIGLMTTGLDSLASLAATTQSNTAGTAPASAVQQTTTQTEAQGALQQAIDILNTDQNGRYLFSGRATTTEPVQSYDTIVNGDASHAGLTQLISERGQADLGANGLGRLTLASSGTSVTLGEEAAGLPFGFNVAGASATGTGLSAAAAPGPPASATVSVASQPAAGDTVSVVLGLPDGTSQTVTLTARSAGASAADGSFAIGATPAATAANLSAALGGAVRTAASTSLASASAVQAATDFFAASPSNPPQRVAGPPFDTATSLAPASADDTVVWYQGDDSASPRTSATVRVADGQSVAIGAQADEPAFRTVLANLAVLATGSFSSGDPTAQGRYDALASRVSTNLAFTNGAQSVSDVAGDLSVANASIKSAQNRNSATSSQLQNLADGIDNADLNDVATKLLDAQTRLQASYQTTSLISRLSLADYLQ